MSKSKVLFIMTGSIACYKACQVISRLVQNNSDVQVVATPAALKFVGNATLEGLSGRPVISDMYATGNVMEHIHLMRWADLILVAPATANFINKAAQGIGDDLVQTLFLAHDFQRPFLVAPAMNKSMYTHPVTQKSLQALRDMGIEMLDSASGILACGEEGWGRLLEPDMILQSALQALQKKSAFALASGAAANAAATPAGKTSAFSKIKVLVTAGGTQEPIDTVRVISNLSSGRTGVTLAETLEHMGFAVTLLQAHGSAKTNQVAHKEYFTSFKSLDEKMQQLLGTGDYTHVIHAAAVSDYSVDSIEVAGTKYSPFEVKKISSNAENMDIHLKRNHKIVDRLRDYAKNKDLKVMAFKLTSHASAEDKKTAVDKLFKSAHADFVVHNDLTDIDIVNRTHKFSLISPKATVPCESLETLANELLQVILPKEAL